MSRKEKIIINKVNIVTVRTPASTQRNLRTWLGRTWNCMTWPSNSFGLSSSGQETSTIAHWDPNCWWPYTTERFKTSLESTHVTSLPGAWMHASERRMSTAKGPGNFRDSWTQSGGAPINGFYFDAILHRTWPLTFVSGRICVKHFCNSNGHIQVLHGDRSVSAELVNRANFINHVTCASPGEDRSKF